MTVLVKHTKVSTIPDDTDTSLIRPSDWNADHTLVGTIDVANGGTGASTLTGYVKGNGTSAMTAVATVPSTDITGLGTMSTQNATAVAITGGTIDGTSIGATTPSTGVFTTLTGNSTSQFGRSSANYAQITGAASGSDPTFSALGSDTNINFTYLAKGSLGEHRFSTNTGGNTQFRITHTGSAANYIQVTGAVTGGDPVVSAQGSDTNIDLALQPKGTGALQAQATTSTTAGGNARGANAVDWQTSRVAASQVASGQYSFIGGGIGNTSNGTVTTVAGGNSNVVGGTYAGALSGISNTVNGFGAAVVTGYTNTAAGHLNFIGGGFSNSGTSASAVTTQSGTMNGTTAVTLSGSNANIKVGQFISGTSIATFPSTYVAAISGTSLTLSQNASGSSTSTLSFFTPHGVVVGGGNNQATGSYSFIGGGGDAGTAANRNVASGDWSVVCGGHKNTASGQSAFVGAGGDLTAGSVFGNTASGTASGVVTGANSTASGYASFIGGGVSNTNSGIYGFIGGGIQNTVNTIGAISGGVNGTIRGIIGNHVFPACNSPIADVSGVSQAALLVLGAATTDATATALRTTTSAAGTTNQVILPNNSAYFFTGEVVSGVTGGGNTKGFTIEGVIKRGANAASTALVGTPTVTSMYADVGAATWAIAVTADTTNGGLRVTFTGQAATTIRTVCQIRTTEMTY